MLSGEHRLLQLQSLQLRESEVEEAAHFSKERKIVVKAYIMVVTDPGKTKSVFEEIGRIEQLQEVHEVMGPYDIVATVEAISLNEVPSIVTSVRKVEGIQSTLTLTTFPDV